MSLANFKQLTPCNGNYSVADLTELFQYSSTRSIRAIVEKKYTTYEYVNTNGGIQKMTFITPMGLSIIARKATSNRISKELKQYLLKEPEKNTFIPQFQWIVDFFDEIKWSQIKYNDYCILTLSEKGIHITTKYAPCKYALLNITTNRTTPDVNILKRIKNHIYL